MKRTNASVSCKVKDKYLLVSIHKFVLSESVHPNCLSRLTRDVKNTHAMQSRVISARISLRVTDESLLHEQYVADLSTELTKGGE